MGIFDKIKNVESGMEKKKTNPIEIFNSLNHKMGYEYLRDIQATFLKEWYLSREERDVVGIANTGSGKTLIGLLMLYSKMNEGIGPVVYLCPDNQLVEQVVMEAEFHGIPVTQIRRESPDSRQEMPIDFINSQAILITTFEKMYNGHSIFGVTETGNREIQDIGALLIDDAHTCIKKARKQSSFLIPKDHDMYKEILDLFERDLESQGSGVFHAIKKGEKTVARLVPYWSYQNKIKVLKKIIEKNDVQENFYMYIPFNLIFDYLEKSNCYISGDGIEITPLQLPLDKIPSFFKAKHRFVLSATFNNMPELITELGISKDACLHPINIKKESAVGERLIIAPKRYSSELTNNDMKSLIKLYWEKKGYNIVILVPNIRKAQIWKKEGALIVDKENISDAVNKLKNGNNNFMVLINRYDGIDLWGNMCHLLILDGLPKGKSIRDIAVAHMRSESPLTKATTAQTIEQGLGRSVRSGSDYCVTLLLDDNLLNFISNNNNRKYFSETTRAQLDLGISLSMDFFKEKRNLIEAKNEIVGTINLVLDRNPDWISYYKTITEQYLERYTTVSNEESLILAQDEYIVLSYYKSNKISDAVNIIREKFIANGNLVDSDIGWYFQLAAQIMNRFDETEANNLQVKAKELNSNLLIPRFPDYSKKTKNKTVQAMNVKKWIVVYSTGTDLKIAIDSILSKLLYVPNADSNIFEDAIKKLGDFLGYTSSRPEQERNDGPDNLWVSENNSFIIECKNQGTSQLLPRKDMEQVLHSLVWYQNYFLDQGNISGIIFRKSNILAKNCHAGENIYSVNQEKLDSLKTNVSNFSAALCEKSPNEWTISDIEKLLRQNYLLENQFIQNFTVNFK